MLWYIFLTKFMLIFTGSGVIPNIPPAVPGGFKGDITMKKIFAFISALVIIFALCACEEGTAEVVVESPASNAPAAAAAEAPVSGTQAPGTGSDDLGALLDMVLSDVRPGSSGCSLRSINCAARLLDWSSSAGMSDDEIGAAVQAWTDRLSEEERAVFTESILSVSDSCESLKQENAQELLDESGSTGCGYPWDDAAFMTAESVFAAAGIR